MPLKVDILKDKIETLKQRTIRGNSSHTGSIKPETISKLRS